MRPPDAAAPLVPRSSTFIVIFCIIFDTQSRSSAAGQKRHTELLDTQDILKAVTCNYLRL